MNGERPRIKENVVGWSRPCHHSEILQTVSLGEGVLSSFSFLKSATLWLLP